MLKINTVEIVITSIQPHFGFGMRTDTYDQVYLPKSVVGVLEVRGVQETDAVRVQIAENKSDPKGMTPWFAIMLAPVGEPEEPEEVKKIPLTKRVFMALETLGGVATCNEVMREVGEDKVTNVRPHLESLWRQDKLLRVAVQRYESDRAGKVWWATSYEAIDDIFGDV
jgi:hypothetical protein